ncbi:MAG: sulfatase-like hydrolase/transferase [Chitinophagales bacterium]|nr:sulfatase-like hydrolase/transferase [Chitinophagales bacterium]
MKKTKLLLFLTSVLCITQTGYASFAFGSELGTMLRNSSYFQTLNPKDSAKKYTIGDSLIVSPLPNILLIILDDARYDSYSSNGGPSFLQTPAIDRIANEGVNFKNSFVTYSLCAPSRATMLTGLYPHNNGAYNNEKPYRDDLPTTGSLLHDKGYYTAMLGKYLYPALPNEPHPGWDFWMAADKWAKINPRYNRNGTEIYPKGHEMDILTDTAIHYFATRADTQPLFLMLCYLSPHKEWIPEPEDSGIFANASMPFPSNFYKYADNYPSWYDTLSSKVSYSDSDSLRTDLEAYLEVVYGLDGEIGRLLDTLQAMDKLDNTLILFVSDNGFFFGEHTLKSKNLAQEESIRVPVYVRYPQWFAPGSIDSSQLITNLDIAPTILAAADIPDTFGMPGFSLKDLYDGIQQRDAFYIELIQDTLENYPDFRAVRSKQYKYIHYFCTAPAEEFFDLTRDPKEDTNQINNPSYQLLVNEYRYKLDSFTTLLNDTVPAGYFDCHMVESLPVAFYEPDADLDGPLYPNPASDKVIFNLNKFDVPGNISVYASDGQLVLYESLIPEKGKTRSMVDVSLVPNGLYLFAIQYRNKIEYHKLMVVH